MVGQTSQTTMLRWTTSGITTSVLSAIAANGAPDGVILSAIAAIGAPDGAIPIQHKHCRRCCRLLRLSRMMALSLPLTPRTGLTPCRTARRRRLRRCQWQWGLLQAQTNQIIIIMINQILLQDRDSFGCFCFQAQRGHRPGQRLSFTAMSSSPSLCRTTSMAIISSTVDCRP